MIAAHSTSPSRNCKRSHQHKTECLLHARCLECGTHGQVDTACTSPFPSARGQRTSVLKGTANKLESHCSSCTIHENTSRALQWPSTCTPCQRGTSRKLTTQKRLKRFLGGIRTGGRCPLQGRGNRVMQALGAWFRRGNSDCKKEGQKQTKVNEQRERVVCFLFVKWSLPCRATTRARGRRGSCLAILSLHTHLRSEQIPENSLIGACSFHAIVAY